MNLDILFIANKILASQLAIRFPTIGECFEAKE